MAFVTHSLISEAWQEKWVSKFVTTVTFLKFKLQRKLKNTHYPLNSTEHVKMELAISPQKLRKKNEQSNETIKRKKGRKKVWMSK